MEKNLFEAASKMKLRFSSNKGMITSEDLWDLSLADLDEIARETYKRVRDDMDHVSFVRPASKVDSTDLLRLDILKRVIEVKMEERDAAEKAVLQNAKKQRILNIMAEKEDENLKGASLEDLRQMLAEL
jgi:hypothetical protein